jgi:GST-like protein
MIELYTFGTGNGKRASVILEECGLAYNVHKVDLAKGEQMSPEFRRINPLGVIPAIVDSDGPGGKPLTLTQSGAIALYAAEKSGRFLPRDPVARLKVTEWLMHAVSDAAPTTGFIFQSGLLPEKPVAVLDKFKGRLLGFLKTVDAHLANHEYLAGELSIADFALYTSAVTAKHLLGPQFTGFANVDRWMAALAARPGVARGMQVPA